MNGYNFTDRVRKVLQMAREEAARLHHEYVGTEHILLGSLEDSVGTAGGALAELGVTRERAEHWLTATLKRMAEGNPPPGLAGSRG